MVIESRVEKLEGYAMDAHVRDNIEDKTTSVDGYLKTFKPFIHPKGTSSTNHNEETMIKSILEPGLDSFVQDMNDLYSLDPSVFFERRKLLNVFYEILGRLYGKKCEQSFYGDLGIAVDSLNDLSCQVLNPVLESNPSVKDDSSDDGGSSENSSIPDSIRDLLEDVVCEDTRSSLNHVARKAAAAGLLGSLAKFLDHPIQRAMFTDPNYGLYPVRHGGIRSLIDLIDNPLKLKNYFKSSSL